MERRAEAGARPVSTLHERSSYAAADFDVPTGREEEWRFTPLRRLRDLHKGAPADGKVLVEVDAAPEVRVETVGRGDERLGRSYTPTDRVSAQAWESFAQATVLTVPQETVAARPTIVRLRGDDPDNAAYGHLLVDVKPYARATVVLEHSGAATYADNVEFVVGEGAALSVVSLQNWSPQTVHLSHQHATLGKDARFSSFVVSLGGGVVRIAPTVCYGGQGGDAELYGVYFVDPGQHLEHRLLVDHAVPNCRSRVDYRGALQGEGAHAVWIGDVIIRPEAEGTDTYELNRNLVLTDGTRVDSVPNLEILTGEVVGAGHASASGRIDDQHLFYLQARGIPHDEARRMVVRGFLDELLAKLQVPEVREQVATAIEQELAGAEALSAPSAERVALSSEREARRVAWTEERAERGTSEHATREGRAKSGQSAERETR